jgi:hypothetical protein
MLQLTLDINRVLRNSGQQTKVVYLLVGIHGLGNIYTVMSQAKRFAKRVVHFFVSYEISLNVSRLKSTFLFEVGPGDNNKNSLTASNSITGAPTTNTQHTQKSQETQCSWKKHRTDGQIRTQPDRLKSPKLDYIKGPSRTQLSYMSFKVFVRFVYFSEINILKSQSCLTCKKNKFNDYSSSKQSFVMTRE